MRSHSKWRMMFVAGTLAILTMVAVCHAAPVIPAQARQAVAGWLRAPRRLLNSPAPVSVAAVEPLGDLGFVVKLLPSGFVVVPADDRIEPVLAFAGTGDFSFLPGYPPGDLLRADLRARWRKLDGVRDADAGGVPGFAQSKWRYLAAWSDDAGMARGNVNAISDQRVPPLLQTVWDQCREGADFCYNYFTPNHYPCGCIATGMAQLMRYHKYPTTAVGPRQFEVVVEHDPNPYQTLTILGGDGAGGAYDWDSMPVDPDENTPDVQRRAIGALCVDAGMSANMRYGPIGSAADIYTAMLALKDVFYFNQAVYGWNNFEFIGAGLLDMVNPNLDAGLPVLFSVKGAGGMHAIVCDGYGYEVGTLYHHLNMGWGADHAADNVWYALPGIDATLEFDCVDVCIYNIFPQGVGEIISGRVCDAFGNPLTDAVVVATRQGGGQYQAIANRRGIYALAGLPASSVYTVIPAKSGYAFAARTVSTGASADFSAAAGNRGGIDFVGAGDPADPPALPVMGDYSGHGTAVLALYEDDQTRWHLRLSGGVSNFSFGVSGCRPVLADFDDDGRADPGLYHDGYGMWGVQRSGAAYGTTIFTFGNSGSHPVAADFDGDGRADPALYHPASGYWLALLSKNGYQPYGASFGTTGGRPVAGDFDGDGRADPGTYHYDTGRWRVMLSGRNYQPREFEFGAAEFVPVTGDYDGDGKSDPAIFRHGDGLWRILRSGDAYQESRITFTGYE